jgi:hypothetical protein
MKVYFNAFWSGFIEKTNKNHCGFFLHVLTKVFKQECFVGSFDDSDILVESLFGQSLLKSKVWKYTFLYSGESRLRENHNLYNVILYGERNHDNIINCPLYLSYIYCNNFQEKMENIDKEEIPNFPPNDILAIISNPSGQERNSYLHQIESVGIKVTYAGRFKNNIGGNLAPEYGTPEFHNYVSKFKCIIACENSEGDTYITEKICHGFLSKNIPIYWGSKNVSDYFNKNRYFDLRRQTISELKELLTNYQKWSEYISEHVFANNKRSIDDLVNDISYYLFKPSNLKDIQGVFAICKQEYEHLRYERLVKMFNIFNWNVKFRGSTYKHTITSEIFNKYVKTNEIIKLRNNPPVLKRSELSLTLNFVEVFKEIKKNYSSGYFFICESDIYLYGDIDNISKIINTTISFDKEWDGIHIGLDKPNILNQFDYTLNNIGIKRMYTPKGTDSIIYSYNGIVKILDYIDNEDFSIPWDYIFWNLLKNNKFIFYWSNNEVFIQGTNAGIETSTIQSDMN